MPLSPLRQFFPFIMLLGIASHAVAQTAPPGPPQNFTGVVSETFVILNWQPPTTGGVPTSYLLEASLSPGGPLIASLAIPNNSLTIPGVPNGTYYLRVRSVNNEGQSAPSNEIVVVVPSGGGGGCTSPPNRPHSLEGSVSGTLISLHWGQSGAGCAPTDFALHAGSAPGLSNVAIVNLGLQTSLSGNAPSGTYFIRVIAVNAYGGSPSSNELSLTVGSPTPPPSPVTNWSVTQRFVSVTGPDNCWVREQRARWTGAVFPDLPMVVTRSGGFVTLDGDFFQVNYAGTISGSEFSASGGPLEGGGTPCQDGTSFRQRPGISNLSGRFSADDQLLTASEVNSYLLTTGELVTYTWEWQATRQN